MSKVKEQQNVYRAKQDMSESEMVSNAKASALHALEKLPGDVTYDDIMYELYVLQKIERGQEDIKKRRTVAHKEVRMRLHRWLK